MLLNVGVRAACAQGVAGEYATHGSSPQFTRLLLTLRGESPLGLSTPSAYSLHRCGAGFEGRLRPGHRGRGFGWRWREIRRGTAPFAWVFGASRSSWAKGSGPSRPRTRPRVSRRPSSISESRDAGIAIAGTLSARNAWPGPHSSGKGSEGQSGEGACGFEPTSSKQAFKNLSKADLRSRFARSVSSLRAWNFSPSSKP